MKHLSTNISKFAFDNYATNDINAYYLIIVSIKKLPAIYKSAIRPGMFKKTKMANKLIY